MQIAQRERIRKGRTVPSENRCLYTPGIPFPLSPVNQKEGYGGHSQPALQAPQSNRVLLTSAFSWCRNAFDRLTEFSNILLGNGDYHVHTNHKEQLQDDLRTHASGIKAGMDPHAGMLQQHHCLCTS